MRVPNFSELSYSCIVDDHWNFEKKSGLVCMDPLDPWVLEHKPQHCGFGSFSSRYLEIRRAEIILGALSEGIVT